MIIKARVKENGLWRNVRLNLNRTGIDSLNFTFIFHGIEFFCSTEPTKEHALQINIVIPSACYLTTHPTEMHWHRLKYQFPHRCNPRNLKLYCPKEYQGEALAAAAARFGTFQIKIISKRAYMYCDFLGYHDRVLMPTRLVKGKPKLRLRKVKG